VLPIPSFTNARVLVVGDVMLDRYWHGDTGRISPEAPVPVVCIGNEERRLGGAANVVANLARVGARAHLIGVIGDDEAGGSVRELLSSAEVTPDLVVSAGQPTIAKLRVISRNQQLIRLDFEPTAPVFDRQALMTRIKAALETTDVVICSDYGKGALAEIEAVIAAANARGVPVLVDPKGCDWRRYAGATVITPNVAELESFAGPAADERALAVAADTLRARLNCDALLVTRSEKGLSLFFDSRALHLPAQAREVFDVTGAGDTVIALLAAGLAAGLKLAEAAALANLAAGLVVAKLGTATVTRSELRRSARADDTGIVDEPTLLELVAAARARSQRVVMTNGCFDLLHPGHIAYLEAAAALGDRLLVAINDDASVRRLKGPSRPLNDLAHRMQVLRGLSAVDWVVSFAEDTPERLIGALAPDVLVKGGDYAAADIVGGELVRASGGEVRVLDFAEGFSTSAIIARMRADGK
jgi:D-beta-D-heptose 7-phosphate kinase/D-beta-D-heptose 1-phosphate adenosyltransferase